MSGMKPSFDLLIHIGYELAKDGVLTITITGKKEGARLSSRLITSITCTCGSVVSKWNLTKPYSVNMTPLKTSYSADGRLNVNVKITWRDGARDYVYPMTVVKNKPIGEKMKIVSFFNPKDDLKTLLIRSGATPSAVKARPAGPSTSAANFESMFAASTMTKVKSVKNVKKVEKSSATPPSRKSSKTDERPIVKKSSEEPVKKKTKEEYKEKRVKSEKSERDATPKKKSKHHDSDSSRGSSKTKHKTASKPHETSKPHELKAASPSKPSTKLAENQVPAAKLPSKSPQISSPTKLPSKSPQISSPIASSATPSPDLSDHPPVLRRIDDDHHSQTSSDDDSPSPAGSSPARPSNRTPPPAVTGQWTVRQESPSPVNKDVVAKLMEAVGMDPAEANEQLERRNKASARRKRDPLFSTGMSSPEEEKPSKVKEEKLRKSSLPTISSPRPPTPPITASLVMDMLKTSTAGDAQHTAFMTICDESTTEWSVEEGEDMLKITISPQCPQSTLDNTYRLLKSQLID